MNNLYILIIVLLIISPLICNKKQIEKFFYPKLNQSTSYTFTPYHTDFTKNIGHRGCENSKYWDCITNHPSTTDTNNVNETVHTDCKQYSNDQCKFPSIISQSRNYPYYQYLNYV